jgi:predicted outer membrane repeat protein
MTQNNAGIVNLFFCSFTNNFSTTRGAAIYSRTDQMNIVGCQFIDNACKSEIKGVIVLPGEQISLFLQR